jgi:polysaccharide export outer membrane protein
MPQAESDAYHLGPGDQVRIITLSEDRLTGEFRVNDSDAVALPLLRTIQATGLTTAELERTIGADLVKAQLIRDPSVSVEVLAYRPIFALGEVNRPGQYAYQPGMIVVTAVAAAGASPIAPSRIARPSCAVSTAARSRAGRSGKHMSSRVT